MNTLHKFAIILIVTLLLAGCALFLERPTPSPVAPVVASPTPSSTSTPAPSETPTEEADVDAQAFRPGVPTSVPILYKMFDYGTDFQEVHPEWGPVGSVHFYTWQSVNPGPEDFNWTIIERNLAKESGLTVTMPDGEEVPKPVVIQLFVSISSAPNWDAQYYDCTPEWVYDRIDAENPDDPRPIVQGRKVGHAINGCGKKAIIPMYDSAIWREAYYNLVRALGEKYDGHPQVTAVVLCPGLDGETQIVKDTDCSWNSLLDQQAGAVRYRFGEYIAKSMDVHHEAFPNTPLFINNAPGGSGMRKATSDYAASFDPPIGLKHCGMWVDLDSHQGYGDYYGSWDLIRSYSATVPIWLESAHGLGGKEHRYWSFMAGLHYHPDAIDVHPEFLEQSDPEWLRFVSRHLGVSIDDTPDVFTVLRDAEYPLNDWGSGGCSGYMGDWTFWLYRREDAPQSATERVMREDMPAAREHVFSRQARRTQQKQNNVFMSFDIDDGYPYVEQKPISLEGGDAYYRVHVTLLNRGTDAFALEYRDWDGAIVRQVETKGSKLGDTDDWVTASFTVENGYFDNNMPGNCDFRISCERDGDEYIHMVRVEGGWGTPPPLTPTPSETPIPPPTPTPTGPTPVPSPTPDLPTPTPLPTPTVMSGAVRFDPRADVFLDAWRPAENFYQDPKLAIRQQNVKIPLLRFDLEDIPSNAVIDQAVLNLYITGRSNAGGLLLSAHKVLRPWDAASCTWEQASRNSPWGVPGCGDPNGDFSTVTVDETALTEKQGWAQVLLTPLVQEWVERPEENYGLTLRTQEENPVQYDLASSAYWDSGVHPVLWVAWHEGSSGPLTPSPTATKIPSPKPTRQDTPPSSPVATATPLATSTPEAGPTVLTLREGGGAKGVVVDTFIDSWRRNRNYESGPKLVARQGSVRVPLMRFDLSRIPDNSSIKRAVLHLYAASRSNTGSVKLSIAKVQRPWDPEYVTWDQATASEAWVQAGAKDPGGDRSSRLYASELLSDERVWTQLDVRDLVQEWVSDGAHNHGLLMVAEGTVSVEYSLTSSSWVVEDYRPYLEVEYIPASAPRTPVPTNTPTSAPTFTATPTATSLPLQQEYLFQQGTDGYQGCVDTFVDRWNPQRENASSDKLIVRQGGVRSALLRYDLSPLPQGSQIERALLYLYVRRRSAPYTLPISVYGVMRPWEEQEATYERASAEKPWYEAGLGGVGRDISAVPVTEAVLGAERQWIPLDITPLVRAWMRSPNLNHGLVVKAAGQIAVQYQFASSEHWLDPSKRPRLQLHMASTTATPVATETPREATPTATSTGVPAPSATPTKEATPYRFKLALQQGLGDYEGVEDTYLDAWNQTARMGQDGSLRVRRGGVRSTLLRYDLEHLPAGARLARAELKLWTAAASNRGDLRLCAYEMLSPWEENLASWVSSSKGRPWWAPGASGLGEDRDDDVVAEIVLSDEEQWVSLDVTEIVREWLAHPEDNYGLFLRGEGETNVEYTFASSQWRRLAGQRPKLLLTFEVEPDVIPAEGEKRDLLPWIGVGAGVALLVIVLLAGRRVRRRRREVVD